MPCWWGSSLVVVVAGLSGWCIGFRLAAAVALAVAIAVLVTTCPVVVVVVVRWLLLVSAWFVHSTTVPMGLLLFERLALALHLLFVLFGRALLLLAATV